MRVMHKACMSTYVCITLQQVWETFFPLLKIRDRLKLPQLKAVVQYKEKLRKELCSQNYLTKEYCEVTRTCATLQ